MKSVYLAGPITGLTYDEATDWRTIASDSLKEAGIEAFSPLRHKKAPPPGTIFSPLASNTAVWSTAKAIVTRDKFDATRCDVLLVNLIGAPRVSIGTMFEMAWAFDRGIPIVCAMEGDGSDPHEHVFVQEVIGFRVATLGDAIAVVKGILV